MLMVCSSLSSGLGSWRGGGGGRAWWEELVRVDMVKVGLEELSEYVARVFLAAHSADSHSVFHIVLPTAKWNGDVSQLIDYGHS